MMNHRPTFSVIFVAVVAILATISTTTTVDAAAAAVWRFGKSTALPNSDIDEEKARRKKEQV
eukprot:CAMPEP_0119557932 /NCGR_PEP_ID=MMETSP1352-20130426/9755_1 /TAXON_ID=265584 /ORGANISM="Stauroneis constricta, Strain CCMP1120" /LENGTH=61 /DNA_ID=CAMNT_0007605113 /DNA_START=20 /DNA_END=201 /DNA_ORIENTATION=+